MRTHLMEGKMLILGNESSVIYYNLNKQFSNVRKIIITKEIILSSFEDTKIKEIFAELSNSSLANYDEILGKREMDGSFESIMKNDLYKQIQEGLPSISQSSVDIQLKDYNFMNTVSNTKFNVTLRCESFSITHYYQEKGALLSAIRNLIKEYLKCKANCFRLSWLENFQIEIYETEEIYKSVFLKKEGNSLILSSIFGFMNTIPFDYATGQEFYFSIGENFKFYKNSQTHAVLRDHTKLLKQEINPQEKILTNEDLVLINENTKNINDALIEIVLTKKNQIRIVNLSLLENSIYTNSENGFAINKSTKNYDRISLSTLRDNLDEDSMNPKYLLIRNNEEIEEFLENITMLEKVEGVVFNSNFYMPILDKLGQSLDLDIVFYNSPLTKAIDVKIDLEGVKILSDSEDKDNGFGSSNPFSNILGEENKPKDELLERLKNIDLNSPNQQETVGNGYNNQISNVAQGIISSPNASTSNNSRSESNMNWGNSNNSNGKKSAISMLADSVINNNMQPKREEPQKNEVQSNNMGYNSFGAENQDFHQHQQHQEHQGYQENNHHHHVNHETNNNQMMHENSNNKQPSINDMLGGSSEFDSHNNYGNVNHNHSQDDNNSFNHRNEVQKTFQNSSFVEKGISHSDVGHVSNEMVEGVEKRANELLHEMNMDDKIENSHNHNNHKESIHKEMPKADINRYENILGIKIITPPTFPSKYQFADINTIGEVQGGEIFFMANSPENMNNPNLRYILPLAIADNVSKKCHLLVNNAHEFFIADDLSKDYFINITQMDDSIKEKFIKNCCDKFKRISIILNKDDIPKIENSINRIDNVYIQDISSGEDYAVAEEKILSYEKSFLMKYF